MVSAFGAPAFAGGALAAAGAFAVLGAADGTEACGLGAGGLGGCGAGGLGGCAAGG